MRRVYYNSLLYRKNGFAEYVENNFIELK